jgi:L-aminopeptidase/D-esterase-like protein
MPEAVSNWFSVGHVTHAEERTGCTVIVFDGLVPTCVDVRGGAPGTRETDVLAPGRLVGRANAILLTGGSAFGLAAADGVVRWLAEHGRGVATAAGPVPIVPAAVIFDLPNGAAIAPTAADGHTAASSATSAQSASGALGAGTGATVAKLGGTPTAGGLGVATVSVGAGEVTAIVALNALGDVRDPADGRWLARASTTQTAHELALGAGSTPREGEHTTIGAILISTPADRDALQRCCVSAHDALARCVVPAHTLFDGDTFFAAAPSSTLTPPSVVLALQAATEIAVERAIVGLFADR